MTQDQKPEGTWRGKNRFQDHEIPDMDKRLIELEGELIGNLSRYMTLEPADLDELKVEEREWVVQQDGEHLYVGKKSRKTPKSLSVSDAAIYATRTVMLENMANKYVFNEDTYLEEHPNTGPYPTATDILIGCCEQIRQLFENHRFVPEQFKVVYKPLARLARQMTIFEPEFEALEIEIMKQDGITEEEIDVMVKGAKQIHEYFCERFRWYETLAEAMM